MKTEIEAKFLRVNTDQLRAKLESVGAICRQPMVMMRRVIFGNEVIDAKNAYLRVRDEGHRINVTYKQFDEISLTGAKEIEFSVSDYDDAIALFKAIGAVPKGDQEARREIWKLGEVEIVIDEWPWIDPFIEIEAPTEALVKQTAEKLGFEWKDAAFGDIMIPYLDKYPNTPKDEFIYNLPKIRFDDPLPDMLRA